MKNPLSCGGTGGCSGAIPELAFSYTSLVGLTTEQKFPYSGGASGDCDVSKLEPAISNDGFERLPSND